MGTGQELGLGIYREMERERERRGKREPAAAPLTPLMASATRGESGWKRKGEGRLFPVRGGKGPRRFRVRKSRDRGARTSGSLRAQARARAGVRVGPTRHRESEREGKWGEAVGWALASPKWTADEGFKFLFFSFLYPLKI
jgi:hypothetical protein